jgi:hypothetical protein
MTRIAIYIQSFLSKLIVFFKALIKIILQSKWSVKYPESNSKSLVILGNGASLKKDLEVLDKEGYKGDFMAVNFFAQTGLFEDLKPKNYVLADPLFFKFDEKEAYYPKVKEFFLSLYEKCKWKLNVFIPYGYEKEYYKWLDILELKNEKISVSVYNKTNMNGTSSAVQYFYKKKWGMPSPTTVLIPCSMIGIGMGYKTIGLTGAGHNYHEGIAMSPDNVLQIKVPHFYDGEEEVEYKPYYKPGGKETYTISELFMVLHKMFGSYKYVSKFAERIGVQMVNYSKDSYIDEIKKVNNGSS